MISAPLPVSTSALAASAVNHLLTAEPWARHALQAHAGKTACIDAGIVDLHLAVGADGLLEPAPKGRQPDVTLRVKPADLPAIAQQPTHAFSRVTVQGDAGFAAALSQLAESLRWEAEEDLARLVGDVAAMRIVGGARAAAASVRSAHRTLAENLAEYLADEKPVLVRPAAMEQFRDETTQLRDDVERLAKRIERLRRSLDA